MSLRSNNNNKSAAFTQIQWTHNKSVVFHHHNIMMCVCGCVCLCQTRMVVPLTHVPPSSNPVDRFCCNNTQTIIITKIPKN